MSIWVGIDVSAKTLDFGWAIGGKKTHFKIENNPTKFKAALAACPEGACFCMEATGSYYLNIALFLDAQARHVSVINPRRIKHFMGSDLSRSKSDKADAYGIARFGTEKQPGPWMPVTPEMAEMQQLRALADKLEVQMGQLSNQEHAFTQSSLACKAALKTIKTLTKCIAKEQESLLEQMAQLAERWFPRQLAIISSIRGIGRLTAVRLIASVGDFSRFKTSRQLVSFLGLSPTLKQSGTSVHSRGHISRLGGTKMRRDLYFCAVSAAQYNPQCKEMSDRMKMANKPGKVILMAIENKLIRQMHAMVMSDSLYDENYGTFSLAS
jgi:transposase